MNPLARHSVAKMNGIGNRIVVIDLRGSALGVTADDARAIHAAKGLAYDQLMVIGDPRSARTQGFVTIFNNDGGEAGACGNGMRCVAYLAMRGDERRRMIFETKAGLLECRREGDSVFRVDMGRPRLKWDEIPLREPFFDTRGIELQIGPIDRPILHTPSVVNMGNPHAIFWVEDPGAYNLERIGPMLENHPIFPDRANISLAHVIARDHIDLRVWERGVGITQACGSAACATLVAAVRKELTERVARVSLPGGDLTIEWRMSDDHVLMTGPVELEFETELEPSIFAGASA